MKKTRYTERQIIGTLKHVVSPSVPRMAAAFFGLLAVSQFATILTCQYRRNGLALPLTKSSGYRGAVNEKLARREDARPVIILG